MVHSEKIFILKWLEIPASLIGPRFMKDLLFELFQRKFRIRRPSKPCSFFFSGIKLLLIRKYVLFKNFKDAHLTVWKWPSPDECLCRFQEEMKTPLERTGLRPVECSNPFVNKISEVHLKSFIFSTFKKKNVLV